MRDAKGQFIRTHGLSGTRICKIWHAMIARCSNPKHRDWPLYGARGIAVCDRWVNSMTQFHFDMGDPPSQIHQIDRRKNNGNYEPNNCRWVTPKEQARNRRSSLFVTHKGKKLPLAEWSEKTGLKYHTLYQRIKILDWSISRTLSMPLLNRKI